MLIRHMLLVELTFKGYPEDLVVSIALGADTQLTPQISLRSPKIVRVYAADQRRLAG